MTSSSPVVVRPAPAPRRPSAGRAGVVTLVGAALNAVLAFVVAGTVSNVLGADSTGHFFQGIALFSIVATAVTLGTDTAMVRQASRLQALGRTDRVRPVLVSSVRVVLALGTVVATLSWVLAPALAERLVGPDQQEALVQTVRALAPFLPLAALMSVLLGTSRGLGQVYPYTLIQNTLVPGARAAAVGVVVLGALGTGARGPGSPGLGALLTAWAAPLALGVLVAVLVIRRAGTATRAVAQSRADRRELWSFALPRGAAALVERGLDWADVLLVMALAGPAAGGVYAIVRRLAGVGGLLESTMRIVTGPMISRAFAHGDRRELAALFQQGSGVLVLVGGPVYVTLIVLGGEVLALFGPEFPLGRVALAVVAAAFLLETACGMLQTMLLMGGKSHWQLQNKTAQLVVLVVVAVLLVPRLGLLGAALAWAAGVLTNLVLATGQVRTLCGARPSLRTVALPATLVALTFGALPVAAGQLVGWTPVSLLLVLAAAGLSHLVLVLLLRHHLPLSDFWERT